MSVKMQNISEMFSPLTPLGIEVGTQLEMDRGLQVANLASRGGDGAEGAEDRGQRLSTRFPSPAKHS